MTLYARLYTKPGCHLCEQAQAELERLRASHPHHLELIDITADRELLERYGERIPVLEVGGREYAAPLLREALEWALREASAALDATPRAPSNTELGGPARQQPDSAAINGPGMSERVPRTEPAQMATTAFSRAMRHWLGALIASLSVFLAAAFAAPVLAAVGWNQVANALYAAYHLTCHQWAFRSFFLFGSQPVYTQEQLLADGLDPFTFVGSSSLGWKMAFCERDLAIYAGILAVSLLYLQRRRTMQPCNFGVYALLILPMAIDGFTQLIGWRESTWELRVLTGLTFGLASAWLVLPRLDGAFATPAHASPYAATSTACKPLSHLSPGR